MLYPIEQWFSGSIRTWEYFIFFEEGLLHGMNGLNVHSLFQWSALRSLRRRPLNSDDHSRGRPANCVLVATSSRETSSSTELRTSFKIHLLHLKISWRITRIYLPVTFEEENLLLFFKCNAKFSTYIGISKSQVAVNVKVRKKLVGCL